MRNAQLGQVGNDVGGLTETKFRLELQSICGDGNIHNVCSTHANREMATRRYFIIRSCGQQSLQPLIHRGPDLQNFRQAEKRRHPLPGVVVTSIGSRAEVGIFFLPQGVVNILDLLKPY